MKELQKVLSSLRRACEHYGMIHDGDRIAVGLSGGKDSIALLYALHKMRDFYPCRYDVIGISVDLGFENNGECFEKLAQYSEFLGVEYYVVKTQIAQIVFDERKEKNPCSLCARMRRGALNSEALLRGANRVALGHHRSDAVETFMMSLLYEGRIGCFSPVTVYDNLGLSVIRPFIYTTEGDIRSLVRAADLPVFESPCPENGNTERAEVKQYLNSLGQNSHMLYRKIIGAMERRGIDGWYENEDRSHSI